MFTEGNWVLIKKEVDLVNMGYRYDEELNMIDDEGNIVLMYRELQYCGKPCLIRTNMNGICSMYYGMILIMGIQEEMLIPLDEDMVEIKNGVPSLKAKALVEEALGLSKDDSQHMTEPQYCMMEPHNEQLTVKEIANVVKDYIGKLESKGFTVEYKDGELLVVMKL